MHKRSGKAQSATDLSLGQTAPPAAKKLKNRVNSQFLDYQVHRAYEAGCFGHEPGRELQCYRWHNIFFNPADIPSTGTAGLQKTDRIDAKFICRELKDGHLNPINIADRQRKELRALLRRRNALASDFRKSETQVKIQRLYMGIDIPEQLDQPKYTAYIQTTDNFQNMIAMKNE